MDDLLFTYYSFEDGRNYNGRIYFGKGKGIQLACGDTPEQLGEKMHDGVERLAKLSGGTPQMQNMPLKECANEMRFHGLHIPKPMDADEEKRFLSALGLSPEKPKE